MSLEPIYSVGQYPPEKDRGGAPIAFLFNAAGPLGRLQGELHWRLSDFCRIHQIVYKNIEQVERGLDELEYDFNNFTKNTGEIIDDEEAKEMERYCQARFFNHIHQTDQENKRVQAFVDHITVVGLWAIAEQFLVKIYRDVVSAQNGTSSDSITAPYKWHEIIREFEAIGITLTNRENYNNANECRVLNNAIKHSPKVEARLAQFEAFRSFIGHDLENVPLDMQRYLNGVSDLLGSTIERGNKVLGHENV